MEDMEETVVEMEMSVYMRCMRAAEAAGMSLPEWYRCALLKAIARTREI